MLLQKRSARKDSYPGCYDISAAGHVTAGEDVLESAKRELQEELGIMACPEELEAVGIHKGWTEDVFYGRAFKDYEWSHVYLYRKPVELRNLRLQESEVEEVLWMDYGKCLRMIQENSLPNCIYEEEFRMVGKALGIGSHP